MKSFTCPPCGADINGDDWNEYDFLNNTYAGMRVGDIAFKYQYLMEHGMPGDSFVEGYKAGYLQALNDSTEQIKKQGPQQYEDGWSACDDWGRDR